jgi:pimeloyl-ACP methyl ester carboxylesterase
MGAAVAQRFAIDRPDAVEGLVLIAPVPAGGFDASPKLDAMFRSLPGNPEATSAWLSRLTYREPPAEVRKLLRDVAAKVAPEVALESYEAEFCGRSRNHRDADARRCARTRSSRVRP